RGFLITEQLCFAALQGDDPLQPWLESREVGLLPRGGPLRLRVSRDAGLFLDVLAGKPCLTFVIAADLADIDRRRRRSLSQQRRSFQLTKQLADAWLRRAIVQHPGQERQLISPVSHAARRQIGLLVPGQQLGTGSEQRVFARPMHQLCISGLGSHRLLLLILLLLLLFFLMLFFILLFLFFSKTLSTIPRRNQ